MKENAAEQFVMECYKSLKERLEDLYGADCFLPIKATREFIAFMPLNGEVPCPSIFFNCEDLKEYARSTPLEKRNQKYAFLVQFCWKGLDKKEGFFKLRPQYPIDSQPKLFETNPVPMLISESLDFSDSDSFNKERIVKSLLKMMESI